MVRNSKHFYCKLTLAIVLLSVFFPLAKAQTLSSSSGIVKDKNGEVLIGVNVMEKGTTNGTITDEKGRFSLKLTKSKTTLTFSYLGFNDATVAVSGSNPITVVMTENSEELEEMVVIGYGTAKKKDLTGAISRIKTEKLEADAPRNVQDLLRANAAGLAVGMETNAEGNVSLQIRGKNTLSAGSSPLIVVDGVIYMGDLQDINALDIENIDVLKDASSVAVYGAKAANGVIAITTKKGQKGKPVITFNSNLGTVHTSRLPHVVDGAGFLKFRQEYSESLLSEKELQEQPGKYSDPRTLASQGIDLLAWYNYDQKTPVATLPSNDDLVKAWLMRLNLQSVEIDNYMNGVETNWDDIVYQTGLQQDYTASISNRTDNLSYYWSLNYADREGVVTGDRYRNFKSRLNLESTITSFLTVGLNAQFATRIGGYLPCDADQREHNSPYTTNEIDNLDSPYRMYPSGDNNTKNPFFDNLYIDRREITHTLNTRIYSIIKLPFGFEYQMNFTPMFKWYEYMNHKSADHPEWAGVGGESERKLTKTFNWQLDNVLRWKKEFGPDHRIEATFLANAEKGQYWETDVTNKQYTPSDVLGYHNMGSGTVPAVTTNDTYKTGDALMARLFYSFKDRYMLTLSARRDGYSAFGQENPRALFPAVALAWTFSQERFMDSSRSWLDYGKLRLSWGQNGNRDIGQYEALASMNSSLHPYIDLNGNVFTTSQIYINRMANSQLKWERTSSYNIGLDFGLFGNKLRGSVEAYKAETTDLLVSRSLPSILGFSSVKANLGALENKGFELSVDAAPFQSKNFEWNTSATFSLNRRKIKHLYGDMVDIKDDDGNIIGQKEADDLQNKWFIGHDTNQIWDYERNGVWQLGEEEEAAKYGNQVGDFKYVDQNGDGILDNDDKVFQGYTTPRYRVSWRNDFTFFRNFNLSFLMYSHIGQYGTFNRAANTGGMYDRYTIVDIPRWTYDNPTNDYARIGSKNIGSNYVCKTFVRMENITMSYIVPQSFLKRFNIQSMRLSLAVRNPFVITGWSFGDPEGGDTTLRTVNFGVNFTL